MAKKPKNNAAGLFFAFFLKAIVIILGLVILAMGVYLVKQVLSQKKTKAETESDDSAFIDDQTDELMFATGNDADKEDVLFEGKDEEGQDGAGANDIGFEDKIVVLNATDAVGLAAAWKEKLEGAGFKNVQTGNYLNGVMDNSKIVVAEEGKGGNLAQYLPNAKMESLPPDQISMDAPSDDVKAVFIIGNSDNILGQ